MIDELPPPEVAPMRPNGMVAGRGGGATGETNMSSLPISIATVLFRLREARAILSWAKGKVTRSTLGLAFVDQLLPD